MTQLSLRFSGLKLCDLQAMLDAGIVRIVGETPDKKVKSYELTHLGRMMLDRYDAAREPWVCPTAGNEYAADLCGSSCGED